MPETQLTADQLANRENFVRHVHLRSVSVDRDKGEFTGIAVPWDESVEIFGLWKERFERGAVEDSSDAKVFWDHVEVIGKLVHDADVPEGWQVRGKVSRTQRGQDTLTLLEDEAVDGLSIHFDPIEHRVEEDGTVVFTRVRVREVSVTPFPQYTSARVKYLRSESASQQEVTPMTEPTTDAPVATLTRDDLDAALQEREETFSRSLDARLAQFGSRPQAPTELQWRSAGALLEAVADGDQAALDFHRSWSDRGEEGAAFRRAYTGSSTADVGNMPSTWVRDAIKLVDKTRDLINTFNREPLPPKGNKLEYAVIASNTVAVAKQASEGADLTKGKVVVTSDYADVNTYGGWSEMSLQEVKRSTVDMLDTTNKAQTIAFARDSEAAFNTYVNAEIADKVAGADKIDVATDPDLFAYLDAIVDAAVAFKDRGFALDGALVSAATFKKLYRLKDASNRMVFNIWGSPAGGDLAGQISVKGLKGDLANIQVKILAGAPTKSFTFYDDVAFTTWEEPGAPLKLQDENVVNLTKQFSVYGALAFGLQFPGAILPLKYAA